MAAVETPDPRRVRFRLKSAVARLPDLLHGRPAAPAGSCRRSTSRRSATRASRRRRSAPGRTSSSRSRRASSWSSRPSTQYWRKAPEREAAGLQGHPATRRRGWPPSSAARSTSSYSIRGELAEELQRTPGLTLKPAVIQAPAVAQLARPVGPEVAVARPARAAGRQPRHRPARPSTRPITLGHSRLTYSIIPSTFDFYWQPPRLRVRPGPGQEAPRRGAATRTASTRATTTCDISYANVQEAIANYLQEVGIRSQAPAAGARGVLEQLRGQEVQEPRLHGERRLRQRGHAAGGLRGRRRRLRLRQLPGHRRRSSRSRRPSWTARGARRCSTRSSSSCTRRSCYVPIWELAFINGLRPAGAGVGARAHPRPRLLGALRGREAQGQVGQDQMTTPIRRHRTALAVALLALLGAAAPPSAPAAGRPRTPRAAAGSCWR